MDERDKVVTIVGERTRISGNLEGDEDLAVEGRVDGSIRLTRTLIVEPNGVVVADVDVRDAVISGVVVGNVTAQDSVQLLAGARVVGDIVAPRLIIVDGASFRGGVDMGDLEAPRAAGERAEGARAQPAARPAAVARAAVPGAARAMAAKAAPPRPAPPPRTAVAPAQAAGGAVTPATHATPAPAPASVSSPAMAPRSAVPAPATSAPRTASAPPPVVMFGKKKIKKKH